MISPDRTDSNLAKQCKLLKTSQSSLYYTSVSVNADTLTLMNELWD
jgi:putative transposase